MKKLILLLVFPAFFSCEDEPIEPTPVVPVQPVVNFYNAEVKAANNYGVGYAWLNGSEYYIDGIKSLVVKTGDTLRIVTDNVGLQSNQNSTIWLKLDGDLIFSSTKSGDQDTTLFIQ